MADQKEIPLQYFNSFQEKQKQAWDKNNARNYLEGKLSYTTNGENTTISYNGETLQLPKIHKKEAEMLKNLVQTLITERSVCEARMYLARECKAEVDKKGMIPLYSGSDILFNPSPFHLSSTVLPYELLPKTKQETQESIATKIVKFVNDISLESLVPLRVIEDSRGYSYTQAKLQTPPNE